MSSGRAASYDRRGAAHRDRQGRFGGRCVFIFDEPTAALNRAEVDKSWTLLRACATTGQALVYISHRLERHFPLLLTPDSPQGRPTRDDERYADLDVDRLVTSHGRPAAGSLFPASGRPAARCCARRAEFRAAAGRPAVSFQLWRGEIVVLAGLEGKANAKYLRGLAGAERRMPARIPRSTTDGAKRPYDPRRGVAERIGDGVALIPEDRIARWDFFSTSRLSITSPSGHLGGRG